MLVPVFKMTFSFMIQLNLKRVVQQFDRLDFSIDC